MSTADILARHYWAGHGMSYGSPDTCSCGARTRPDAGDEDVMVRRARAFARHQAEMLTVEVGRLMTDQTCPYCHETNAHAQDCLAPLIREATR